MTFSRRSIADLLAKRLPPNFWVFAKGSDDRELPHKKRAPYAGTYMPVRPVWISAYVHKTARNQHAALVKLLRN
jgi:hypothetical protein